MHKLPYDRMKKKVKGFIYVINMIVKFLIINKEGKCITIV